MLFFGRGKKSRSVSDKKKAVAFVDYEHWYISLDKHFASRPDIKAWRDELAEKYDIAEISFFGDFSNQSLRAEIPRIREVTSYIIETQNATQYYKKDFTDFIMLDHIYQRAISSDDIDAFIIFTGDGHFSSVVSFLTTKCRKEVGIYGIKDAISSSLKNTASYCIALPDEQTVQRGYFKIVIDALNKLNEARKNARPTFIATAEAVAKDNNIDKEIITAAMQQMIEKGYLYQTRRYFGNGKYIKILCVNNELAKTDRITE